MFCFMHKTAYELRIIDWSSDVCSSDLSHFAPAALDDALATHRANFRPSDVLDRPHVMVAANCYPADTRVEAALSASSMDQSFVALRTGNRQRVELGKGVSVRLGHGGRRIMKEKKEPGYTSQQ